MASERVHQEETSGRGSDVPVNEWQRATGIFHCQQPKEDGIIFVPLLDRHRPMTFSSARVVLMGIKRDPIRKILALAKVKGLTQP
jgi:hypothetical protein